MTKYESIVKENLKIRDEFLEDHKDTIQKRLRAAAGEMGKVGSFIDRPEIFAINQCIHLASSIVLLGSDDRLLDNTLNSIRTNGKFSDQDPTTVVTIATLYYLISKIEKDPTIPQDVKDDIKRIHKTFDKSSWMLGTQVMKELSIEILPKPSNKSCHCE